MDRQPTLLWEDNHLLAIDKPARMLSAPDITGDLSALDWARESIRIRHHKPGNVFTGLLHRLDRPVSGVLLFARTSKAASRLSEQFRTHSVQKRYLCLVQGDPKQQAGELTDWLIKDEATNTVRRVRPGAPDARESRLRYLVRQQHRGLCLLEVELITGRSHQIRVQLAGIGLPLLGDRKYGGPSAAAEGASRQQLPPGELALHARSLEFQHPTRAERLRMAAPLPGHWARLLGGSLPNDCLSSGSIPLEE